MISLCLTSYNRTGMLRESFAQVADDPRISEIVIVDDGSTSEVQDWIKENIKGARVYLQPYNVGVYHNKRRAISKALNEWCIILDSDNIITPAYIDALVSARTVLDGQAFWLDKVAYMPEFAAPHFDYRAFSGQMITKENAASLLSTPMFEVMLNCMNYFVNRDEYLRTWQPDIEPLTADSILQNANWLDAGNSIYIVPSMQYEHRVHSGSHYKLNRGQSNGLYETIINRIKGW